MSDDKTPRFKLSPNHTTEGSEHWVGGHRDNQPERVKLTPEEPYVEGEEYRVYAEHGILVFDEWVKDEEPEEDVNITKEEAESFIDKLEQESEEKTEEEEDEDVFAGDLEEDEEVSGADRIQEIHENEPENQDELDASLDVEESDDLELDSEELEELKEEPEIPEDEVLEEMRRDELVNLAKRVEEWDNVEPTGKDNYKQVRDIIVHLKDVREE